MKPKLNMPQFAVLSLGFLLLGLFALRQAGLPSETSPLKVEWQRDLRFLDGPQGEIVVMDALTETEISRIEGEQGFLRGTLRAWARDRKRRDLDSGPAFELLAHPNGRMTLKDTATGQQIDLASFGPSNVAVFERIKGDAQRISAKH